MNRKKLLVENFLVYGIGGVISKIVPFIMLPIITYLLPNETYFGINDLFNTVTSLGCAVGMVGMSDTAFRFFFDKDDLYYKKSICITSCIIALIATGIVVVVLFLSGGVITRQLYGSSDYYYLIGLNALAVVMTNAMSLISLPTRMLNKRKTYLFVNSVMPIITYTAAIFMIIEGWYVCALPLALVVSGLTTTCIFWHLNKEWFSFRFIERGLIRKLIRYGGPIVPQYMMYFVMNASDKWMIAYFLGQSYNGVYAVGGKFGQVSQLIYTAFAGGWVYYRYATMEASDQVENTSKIYELLAYLSSMAFIACCVFSKPVIILLFREIYYNAFIVIPYLFLAPLVQMLFQVAAGQFSIIKITWPNLVFLSIGAICNVVLNFYMIPQYGIEGAAIATIVGYIVTMVVCSFFCVRKKMLYISRKTILTAGVSVAFYVIWRMNTNTFIIYAIAALASMILISMMHRRELKEYLSKGNNHRNEIQSR